jgi:hypothetical protein
VAFPRLNSLGFWFLPAGYILLANPAFLRSSFYKYFDKPSFYYDLVNFKDDTLFSQKINNITDSTNFQ